MFKCGNCERLFDEEGKNHTCPYCGSQNYNDAVRCCICENYEDVNNMDNLSSDHALFIRQERKITPRVCVTCKARVMASFRGYVSSLEQYEQDVLEDLFDEVPLAELMNNWAYKRHGKRIV